MTNEYTLKMGVLNSLNFFYRSRRKLKNLLNVSCTVIKVSPVLVSVNKCVCTFKNGVCLLKNSTNIS